MSRDPRSSSLFEGAALFAAIAAPMAVSASRVRLDADASHDEAVARALGGVFTGGLRGLDLLAAQALQWIPLGTRALRAGLAGAGLAGVSGGLLFVIALRLLAGCGRTPRANAAVAWLASMCASLGGAWLVESSTAGSSMLGVALALAPLVILSAPSPRQGSRDLRAPLAACGATLALGYEPLVGLVALGAVAAFVLARRASPGRVERASPSLLAVAVGAAAGCAPVAATLALSPLANDRLVGGLWAAPWGEGENVGVRGALDLVGVELGWTLVGAAALGLLVTLWRRASRAMGAAVASGVAASALAVTLGAPAGPWRFGAASLLLVGLVAALAAVPVRALVVAVAETKVPLAEASAAMVFLLGLTIPLLTLDDALARSELRARGGASAWDAEAFEALPAGSLLLIADRATYARALASRAAGELRPDVTLVPSFDAGNPALSRTLAGAPDRVPLLRDYVLDGEPRERTLSTLAAAQPIAFDLAPSSDRGLARHVVPRGLFALFSAEPRGAIDRLRAIGDLDEAAGDAGSLDLARLRDAIVPPGDARLAALTGRLLDARVRALASLGERDAAEKVSEESVSLALPGVRGARRARRLATSRLSPRVTSP